MDATEKINLKKRFMAQPRTSKLPLVNSDLHRGGGSPNFSGAKQLYPKSSKPCLAEKCSPLSKLLFICVLPKMDPENTLQSMSFSAVLVSFLSTY